MHAKSYLLASKLSTRAIQVRFVRYIDLDSIYRVQLSSGDSYTINAINYKFLS